MNDLDYDWGKEERGVAGAKWEELRTASGAKWEELRTELGGRLRLPDIPRSEKLLTFFNMSATVRL